MRLTIEVTQEDIDKGCKTDSMNCPIALASSRLMKDGYALGVADESAYLNARRFDEFMGEYWQEDIDVSYGLPRSARQFVDDFDNGKPVQPFSFTLTGIPRKYLP